MTADAKTGGGRTITGRTLFLSDIHPGFRQARARERNEFRHAVESECIVLGGDIVDALCRGGRHALHGNSGD